MVPASCGGLVTRWAKCPLQLTTTTLNWLLTALVVLLFLKHVTCDDVIGLDPCIGAPFSCSDTSKIYRVANPDNNATYFNCTLGVLYLTACPKGQVFDRILYSCSTTGRPKVCGTRADYRNFLFTTVSATTVASLVTSPQSEPISTVRVAVVTAGQSDAGDVFTTGLAMTSLPTNSSANGVTVVTSSSTTYTTANVAVDVVSSETTTGSSSGNGNTATTLSVTSLDYAASSVSALKVSQQSLASSSVQNTTTTTTSVDLLGTRTSDPQLSTRRSLNVENSSSTTTDTYLQQSSSTAIDQGAAMTNSTGKNIAGPTRSFNSSTSSYVDSIGTQESSAAPIAQSSSITQSSDSLILSSVTSLSNNNTAANNSTMSPQRDEKSTRPSISNLTAQSTGSDRTTTTTNLGLPTSVLSQQVSTVQTTTTTDTQRSPSISTVRVNVSQNVTDSVSQPSTSTQIVSSTLNIPSTQTQMSSTGQGTESSTAPNMATPTSVPSPISSTVNQNDFQDATWSDTQDITETPSSISVFVTTSSEVYQTPDNNTTSNPAIYEHKLTSSTGSNVTFEGSSFSLDCSFRIRNINSPPQVNEFVWSRDGQKLVPGAKIQISSDRRADEAGWWNSTIKFVSVVPSLTGHITCYIHYNGGYVDYEGMSIVVIPLPTIQISPLSVTAVRGQQVVVDCRLVVEAAATSPSYFTWYLNGQIVTNTSVATISNQNTSSTLNITATNDIIVSCMASNKAGNSPILNAAVMAVSDTDYVCLEETNGNLTWPRTRSNAVSYISCPPGTTGQASRRCVPSSGSSGGAEWQAPNMNNCVDDQLNSLQNQLKNLEQVNNATALNNFAASLELSTAQLSGGNGITVANLNASVNLIQRLADIHSAGQPASGDEIKSVINAVNNLLNPLNMKSWNQLGNSNQQTTVSPAVALLKSVDIFGNQLVQLLNANSTTMQIPTQNLILQAVQVPTDRPISLPSPDNAVDLLNTASNYFTLSTESMNSIGQYVPGGQLSMYTVLYRNINNILPVNTSEPGEQLNSQVMSLSIAGLNPMELFNPPITFVLTHNEPVNSNLTANCAFWNYSSPPNGDWSTTNCSVVSSNSTHTQCQCSHLTNFAILMSLSPIDNIILSIISLVGCSLSIAALALTILIYAIMWKYFKSHHAVVLINFCIALIIANAIFLGGVDKTQSKVLCLVIAVLLHYFYLVSFCMMLAEGVEMLLYIVFVFHVQRRSETAALIFAAWFIPAIVVGISLAITRTEGYGSDTSCWLSVQSGLIWAFVAPALLILLANFIILIIVLHRISRSKYSTANKNEQKNRVRATMWNILVLCPILGITWVFGVLSVNNELVAFQYIFAVANSLQGVFVFLFHAVCHNRKVKGSYSSRRPICFDWSSSKSNTVKSSKSGSHVNSSSDSSHSIVAPAGKSTAKSTAKSRRTVSTFSDLPADHNHLAHHDVIDYPNGYTSFRASNPNRDSVNSWASTAMASDSTVSTNLTTSTYGSTALIASSMDFTYL